MRTQIGWAIINWDKSDIVNDGLGKKRIYRSESIAKEECKELGFGTMVRKVKIDILKNKKDPQ